MLNRQWKIWKQALDEIGQKFANFRYQLAPEYPAIEQIVLAKAGIGTAPKLTGVSRAAFGLPLPFYFRSVQQALENRGVNRQKARREAQAIIKPTQEGVDRRASPLLIRAARLANGQYTLVITVFKAELLEYGEKLALKQDQRVLRKTIPTPGLGLIDTFLDDLKSSIPLLEVEHW